MINLIIKYSELIFIALLFSPGLRKLYYLFYPILGFTLFFSFPSIKDSLRHILQSKLSTLLITFNLIVFVGLFPNLQEFSLGDFLSSVSRIALNIILILLIDICNKKFNSFSVCKVYLIICFLASALIYIQYLTGPLDIFSEMPSTRSGLPRFSTLSGSTNVFSISVSFSILLSTFFKNQIGFLNGAIRLLLYQVFILGAAIANISRSGLFASLIAFIFCRLFLIKDVLKIQLSRTSNNFIIKTKVFTTKFKISYFYTFLGLSSLLFVLRNSLVRYARTMLYFFTGNKALLDHYSNATYESPNVIKDFLYRFYDYIHPELKRHLIYEPWILFIGDGSKHFGGTIGINRAYAHNMFIDVFQALGILGIALFILIIITIFSDPSNQTINKIKFTKNIKILSISTLFLLFCTHNSGILFHPLTISPLLIMSKYSVLKNKS